MTAPLRIALTLVLGVGSVLILAFGFARLDEVFGVEYPTLRDVSAGADADWGALDPAYIVTHVVLDLVFIGVYGTFFALVNTFARARRPEFTGAALAALALTVVLDVTEDVLFLMQVSSTPLSVAKLLAFGATFVLSVVRAVSAIRDSRRRA